MKDPIRYKTRPPYEETWGAQSDSTPGKVYIVSLAAGRWACSCPRWTLNKNRPECKHIRLVREFRAHMATRAALDMVPTVELPADVAQRLEREAAKFALVEF